MSASEIDVPRLIRIATFLLAILVGSVVFVSYEPHVEGLQLRLADAETTLRSDEIAFAEAPHVRAERDALARRYRSLFAEHPQAVFLRELGKLVRKHGVRIVSTVVAGEARDTAHNDGIFAATHVDLELNGRYAPLLATVDELSQGLEIVRVDAPTLKRDGDGPNLQANVPVTIFGITPPLAGADGSSQGRFCGRAVSALRYSSSRLQPTQRGFRASANAATRKVLRWSPPRDSRCGRRAHRAPSQR